jgi:hypothetical protein
VQQIIQTILQMKPSPSLRVHNNALDHGLFGDAWASSDGVNVYVAPGCDDCDDDDGDDRGIPGL